MVTSVAFFCLLFLHRLVWTPLLLTSYRFFRGPLASLSSLDSWPSAYFGALLALMQAPHAFQARSLSLSLANFHATRSTQNASLLQYLQIENEGIAQLPAHLWNPPVLSSGHAPSLLWSWKLSARCSSQQQRRRRRQQHHLETCEKCKTPDREDLDAGMGRASASNLHLKSQSLKLTPLITTALSLLVSLCLVQNAAPCYPTW